MKNLLKYLIAFAVVFVLSIAGGLDANNANAQVSAYCWNNFSVGGGCQAYGNGSPGEAAIASRMYYVSPGTYYYSINATYNCYGQIWTGSEPFLVVNKTMGTYSGSFYATSGYALLKAVKATGEYGAHVSFGW